MYKNNVKLSTKLNNNRIYIMLVLVIIIMVSIAPKFATLYNIGTIIKSACLSGLVAAGFTTAMLAGGLDLSVGSVINLGAVMAIIFTNMGGIFLGIIAAIIAGIIVGLFNGFVVTKGKLHPFIVTLGTLTTIKGLLYIITGGRSISLNNYDVVSFFEEKVLVLFTAKSLVTIALIVILALFLTKTRMGKVFYLIGGNQDTAWYAGYKVDRYRCASFGISSMFAAIGGMLFVYTAGAAVPNMGEQGVSPQLLVIASSILGGTSMYGGSGSVVKSAFAALTLNALFSGLSCMGAGYEVQIFFCGLLLAIIVIYEAYGAHAADLTRGQRKKLLQELKK